MWQYIIVFVLIIVWVALFFGTIAIRGGNVATEPASAWVAVRDWDDQIDIDPYGAPEFMNVQPRRAGRDDPQPPPGNTGWIYESGAATALLVYYRKPCRLQRRLYGRGQPGADAALLRYGGLTRDEKLRVRAAVAAINSTPLLGAEVKTSGQPYVALPQVVEFEFGLLMGRERLGVAAKMDGQPFVLTIAEGFGVFSIRRYARLAFRCAPGPVTVCAGELVGDAFWIFDIAIAGGRDLTGLPFEERMRNADAVHPLIVASSALKPHTQRFWAASGREEWIAAVRAGVEARRGLETDGLIIQDMRAPYGQTMAMKMKPFEELTVDLAQYGRQFLSARGDDCVPELGGIKSEAVPDGPPRMVEVSLHSRKIVKLRPGKPAANANKTVRQIQELYDIRLSIDDLLGETAQMLKAYMRWREPSLYKWVPDGSRVLDIGAGVGRSQPHWQAHHYRVWAVEPNAQSFERLRRRPGLQSRNMGGQDPAIRAWIPQGSMDGVFMVHSLTFFRGQDMRELAATIAHCLHPGGYLVGIGLDGVEVSKKMEGTDRIESSAFRIARAGEGRITITMRHHRSLVNEQTEYLIDYAEWDRELQAVGLQRQHTEMLTGHWLMSEMPDWFARSTRLWVYRR